jgi:hypothetical protein
MIKLYFVTEEVQITKEIIDVVRTTMRNAAYEYLIRIQVMLSEPLSMKILARQGDALACLLFNVPLVKFIRDAKINTRATTLYRSMQILTSRDDNRKVLKRPSSG